MALGYQLTREQYEALSADMKAHYRELTDGASKGMFRMQFDGADPVGTMRETNITLQQNVERLTRESEQHKSRATTLEAQVNAYKDADGNLLDPVETKKTLEEIAAKGGGKKGPDAVAEMVAAALKPVQTQLAQMTQNFETQKQAAEEQKRKATVAGLKEALRKASGGVLIDSTADLVIDKAVDLFDYDPDTGVITPKGNDGEGNPLTPQRYFDAQRKTAPNLFKQSGDPAHKPGNRLPGGPVRDPHVDGENYVVYDPADGLEIGRASAKARELKKKLKVVRTEAS